MNIHAYLRWRLAEFFEGREMFKTRDVEKIKTDPVCSVTLSPNISPFSKTCGKIL